MTISEPKPPPRVADYDLLQRIGGGSYGEVWLARNVMGTFRAVKAVYRQTFEDDRPFEREFAGIKRFEPISRLHESQVDILHVGRNAECFYYVMELADDQASGQEVHPDRYAPKTLRSEMARQRKLPLEECVKIALALTTALEHLHQHGLVHRDIKPSNIIFIHGAPKLADIGLVTGVEATRSYVGTEGYIPPEGPGTPQADLYGLGKVLYEISTGKDRQDFPEPPAIPEGTPDERSYLEFQEVLLKACENEPGRRYQSAKEMGAELELLKGGKSVKRLRLLERRLALLTRGGLIAGGLLILVALAYLLTVHAARRAFREAQRADREAAHTKLAEQDARERLWEAYLAQAQARRWSGRAGRRFESLQAIRRAAEIRPSIELRNEAIASLGLPDIQIVRQWDGMRPDTTLLAFDRDYERYARGNESGEIRIGRVADDAELFRLAGEGLRVESTLEFSPDQRLLGALYGTQSLKLRVWNLAERKVVLEIQDRRCRTFDFSPDSRWIALAQHDGPIQVFDLESGRLVHSLDQRLLPFGLRFHPRASQLAVSSTLDSTVEIRDLATGAILQSLVHSNRVRGVAWNAQGSLLATACSDRHVYVWDALSGKLRFRLAGHQAAVVRVNFSPRSDLLASEAWDGHLYLWDVQKGGPLVSQPIRGGGYGFNSDGSRIAWLTDEGRVSLGEIATAPECRQLSCETLSAPRASGSDFSPDGRWLLTGHSDGLRLWDVVTAREVAFEPEEDIRCLYFLPAGDAVLSCGGHGLKRRPLISTEDPSAPGFGAPRLFGGRPVALDQCLLTRDGRTVAVDYGGRIYLLDTSDGHLKAETECNPHAQLTAVEPEARWVAAATQPATNVLVRSLPGGVIIRQLPVTNLESVACSPDGRWLVAGSDHDYAFFDTETWRLRFSDPRDGSGGLLGRVAFGAHGRLVAVTHSTRSVQLLELPSGRQLAAWEMADASIICHLRFSPDESSLAVCTTAPSVYLWDLRLIRQQLKAMNLDWEEGSRGAAVR